MWFKKFSLKAAGLVLAGAISSMAAGMAPLTFGNNKTDAENWNYLINFKMWGQEIVSFGNNNKFPNEAGWVGTATGNLESTGNDAQIAGTIVVGGSVKNDNKMELSTGPIRYSGSISDGGRAHGTKCQGTTTAGDCKDVPQYKTNLTVPKMTSWPGSLGNISVSNKSTYEIDARSTTDFYYSNISLGDESILLVKMPKGGRVTRIFTKSLSLNNHPHILVQYEDEQLPRCNTKSSSYTCGGDYEGNLFVFVEGDITFRNSDYSPIDGTIVSTGTINIICNMAFAGQLWAKELIVGNEVKGDGFQFVPIVEMPELTLGTKTATIKENDKWNVISIGLNKEGEEDVTFEYCFEFNGSPVKGQYASTEDVRAGTSSYPFPICGVDSRELVTIPAGQTESSKKIYINTVIDGIVETPKNGQPGEKLWLNIYKLVGAKPATENFESKNEGDLVGGFGIYIEDVDVRPSVTSALVVNVNEDTKHTFTSTEFNYKHSTAFAYVIVNTLPKGTLLLGTEAVKEGQKIAVANLEKMTYQAAANEFGKKYATFDYQVVGAGIGDNTSEVYTATINVIAVNDKPTSSNVTVSVSENPSKDEVLGSATYGDVSNEKGVDAYTFALVSTDPNYTEFNKYFELTSSGSIKVKGNQTFDYYKKSSYTVTATVSDNAKTEQNYGVTVNGPLTSAPFTITVKVQNQNHDPIITKDQVFSIYEKQADGSDWPGGTPVCSKYSGTVCKTDAAVEATDPDGNKLTYTVVTSGIPFEFKKGTNLLVVTNGGGSLLDYETTPVYEFKISVSDDYGGSATATIKVNVLDVDEPPVIVKKEGQYSIDENSPKNTAAKGEFVIFDNDKVSGSYETLTYTLSGALTGAAGASGKLKNKTLADLFYVEETGNSNGTRNVAIKVKPGVYPDSLLDYEALYKTSSKDAVYPVTITIKDAGGNTVKVSTKIAINDVNEAPTVADATFYLLEHSAEGTQVCAEFDDDDICIKYAPVSATDPDSYTDEFKKLSYKINDKKSATTTEDMVADGAFFVIDSYGRVKTAPGTEFDLSKKKKLTYTFRVTVSDKDFDKEATVVVKIRDIEEPPVITYLDGTATVNETTDEINNLNMPIYSFKKEDLPEADQTAFDALGESEDIQYLLGDIGITDKDGKKVAVGTNEQYKNLNETYKSLIKVSLGSGVVQVASAIDYESLYTGNTSVPGNKVAVEIIACNENKIEDDKCVGSSVVITKEIAVVDLNETPSITDYGPYSVDENLASEGSVGYIKATDPDVCSIAKPTLCANGRHPSGYNKLEYLVDEVYKTNGSLNFPFDLNPTTGEITLKKGEKLRYITQTEYRFRVLVRDNPMDGNASKYVTEDVTIKVNDVNEPSEFRVLTNPYEVFENVGPETPLDGKRIIVYDEDEADNNKLKITIKDKGTTAAISAADLFVVIQDGVTDEDTHLTAFIVQTRKDLSELDYEKIYAANNSDAFDVILTIVDGSGTPTEQETRIIVKDKNEKPSAETPDPFSVAENTTNAKSLGSFIAKDPDVFNASFGTLYASLKGDEAAQFDISVSKGENKGEFELTLWTINNAKFDYETKASYSFDAVITDKDHDVTVPIKVNITDVPEGPVFTNVPTLYVDENTPAKTPVTLKNGTKQAVIAVDDDCSNGKTCKTPKYSLTAAVGAPDDYKAFSIDPQTGYITVAVDNILNYEEQNKYVVRVVAEDGSGAKGSDGKVLQDFADVTIYVNDVNDAPVFVEKTTDDGYKLSVDENKAAGASVGSVFAKDEDSWSSLTFKLCDDSKCVKESEIFAIDKTSGAITTKKKLDYETKNVYELWAFVTDNGSSKGFEDLSDVAKVVVNVNDKPDDPVIKDDGKAEYSINEVTEEYPMTNGSIVKDTKDNKDVCYEVTDEDKNQVESLVAYVVDVGNTDADRLFDSKIVKSGSTYQLCLIVKNTARLNYETYVHEHKIKIAVMDADDRVAEVQKTVKIVDVNEMPIISGSKVFSLNEHKGEGYAVGKLNSEDIDTSKVFRDNVFSLVGGDTDLFSITEDGKIKTKRDFDYQTEKVHSFELEVALSDRDNKKYPKLTTKMTVTINLKDVPDVPEITSKEFSVYENSPADSLIGTIKATDPDGDTLFIFSLVEESPYVTVNQNGEIRVKEGAKIDYEKMQKFTIKVKVKDIDALEGFADIVINVIDVNEPPKIEPQEFTFPEDSKPGTKKGPVEAKDPDTKNPKFSDLKFYPVEENEKFEVKENGDIVLKGELDYESVKSYVIKVYVTDGQYKDTTDITVKVGNVVEKSEVEITRVEAGDSVYIKPPKDKPIYTNQEVITVEWTEDGKTRSSLDTLKEGCQYIIKKYKAPNKDVEGADTIEVCYSTAAPIVDIDADKIKVVAENIYTIVENVDKKDSSVYVNNKTKDVEVSVIDTAYKDAGSKYKDKFKVTVVLDTIAVSDKTVKDMVEISKSEITLEKNPKSDVKTQPVGEKNKVSYNKVINGDTVTVSYYTNDKGEIIKTAVVDDNGDKKNIEVIEVSKTVDVKGKSVTVSYKADAETGKVLYGDSEGNLLVSAPKSSSSSSDKEKDSDAVDLKTGVGVFTVTYDAKASNGSKTTVSYAIDEKGKIPSNEEGDRGYLVTYTYTNKYGNSADKSVFMVLDKRAPIVKILTPSDGDVVYANYVDVDWCIAVDGDEKNCVKQDTLKFQSLNKGVNRIKRIYRDKAGNETIAEIQVMMKKAKDVNIHLEEPMVIVSIDSVRKYYDDNPPEKDQKYAVSILNPTTQTEKEVIKGFKRDTKKGSGNEPYPGYEGHIGPTVTIDMKVPLVSAVGGLATLDDIVINGNMIPLDGVDADNSEKATVEEYVEKYCSAEFREELGKDYSKALLYNTTARVTLWFYTTGGQFVDKYHFDYDIDDPEMVDKAGLVKFFFEMKPDINGELRDKTGRLYGTGPYIVKTKVDIRSTQRCVVPPVDKSKVGDVLKSSDEMLKRFGYRRPVLRGNEKSSETSKKEDKKEDSKDEKKSDEKKK